MSVLGAHPWLVLLMPVVVGVLGLAANRLAIWALFRPVFFVGIGPIGWQGVIPRRAEQIAGPLVDRLIERIGTIHDIYDAMDPARISEHLVLSLRPRMAELIEDVVLDVDAALWDELPESVRAEMVAVVDRELPALAADIVADFDAQISDVVDIPHLTQVLLVDDKPLLNHLFRSVGRRSFDFLANIGLVGGLLSGLVITAAWVLVPQWWAAVLVGVVTMALANVVALKAVFGWSTPRRLGRWELQGLLYRDQDRGSRAGTRIFTRDVLSVSNFVRASISGPHGDEIRNMLSKRIDPLVHRIVQVAMPCLNALLTAEEIAAIEPALRDAAIDVALSPLDDRAFNRERQVVLEDVFLNRMLDLAPAEYEALVRPAVRDSEWLLVLVGGVAGLIGGASLGIVLGLLS